MDNSILIFMSNITNGSMSKAVDDTTRLANRRQFLKTQGITPEQTALVHLQYEGENYKRYFTITSDLAGDGITYPPSLVADALFTKNKNLALFLPIADCIAAVLYDPTNQVLGLAHLGRHNLIQIGGKAVIEYMVTDFGSVAADVHVWLSPAAGREAYPMYDFDNRSLHEVAIEQLRSAGISNDNITIDRRDTATDQRLFSHSEYIQGNRTSDGRQAVVAMMRS